MAYNIFGERPDCIGIFYNLIRGQVDYTSEEINMIKTIKSDLNLDIDFIETKINNYIDYARDIQRGEITKYRKDFDLLAKEIYQRLNKKEDDYEKHK